MAFNIKNLACLNGATSPKVWVYETTDAIATVNTAGYFNDASDQLSVRDIIIVADTSTPTTNQVSVLSNASGVVDVSDGTAIAETDTD
jgi:hypothetical protein